MGPLTGLSNGEYAASEMFKWLSRRGRAEELERPVSRDLLADAFLSTESLGRLPENLVEGGPAPQPPSDYIETTTEPSEQDWEHEREARRAQEEGSS